MSPQKEIKFSYALDENKEVLVHIDNAEKGRRYYCVGCGAEMIVKEGSERCKHFAHESDSPTCESYLHKLAKRRIREAFLEAKPFTITLNSRAVCNRECLLKNKCEFDDRQDFDLKKHYDKCKEETSHGGFVADLLLASSENPDRKPVFIEIWVTHECGQKKIDSGLRIIEIKIDSEEDIDAIVSSRNIVESDDGLNKNRFYNFKIKNKQSKEPVSEDSRQIYYLWIKDSGCFMADSYSCAEINTIPEDAHYIVSPFSFSYSWAFLEFVKRGVNVKNCRICKYYLRGSICPLYERYSLYKKYGTLRISKTVTDKNCRYFSRIDSAPMFPYEVTAEYWEDFMKGQEVNPDWEIVVRTKN